MDRYESFTFPGKHVDILLWWKQHEAVLPLLASLAKKILALPSKSERVFSTGGNIVTAKCNRLAPKKVESLIMIKDNMTNVEEFVKSGGYEIKQFDRNPFDEVELVKTPRLSDTDTDFEIDEIEEEEIIFLDDDVDDSDGDDSEDD